tara:strand:+ start:321 stop:677 length:357 start_codon:yes stop_codon:yes gene_type:complete
LIKSFAKYLINIPIITGTVTTKNIFKAIPSIEISFEILSIPKKLIELKTMNGTDIMLTKLVTAVSVIESATSPLANFVSTFDVTPPGAAAISIIPIASSAGVFNNFIKQKATIGSKIN